MDGCEVFGPGLLKQRPIPVVVLQAVDDHAAPPFRREWIRRGCAMLMR